MPPPQCPPLGRKPPPLRPARTLTPLLVCPPCLSHPTSPGTCSTSGVLSVRRFYLLWSLLLPPPPRFPPTCRTAPSASLPQGGLEEPCSHQQKTPSHSRVLQRPLPRLTWPHPIPAHLHPLWMSLSSHKTGTGTKCSSWVGAGREGEARRALLCCHGSHSHSSLNVPSPFLRAVLNRAIKTGRDVCAFLSQPHPTAVQYKEEMRTRLRQNRKSRGSLFSAEGEGRILAEKERGGVEGRELKTDFRDFSTH